ncbi:tetratricopeptide repeat protein 24 isoform X2 [Denticeps clupeoides]|uniref:tetratricopeptide repeat protein 24 isoform X2 n=1 Tax=Denticeps clupeoides TaxID=299321 RepID=UPI0010A3356F|nr:tetratricopeptide repeat protein 24 isoform X2 [Denticeps clupeoides]
MASDGLPPLEGHKRKKKSDNGSRSKGGNANKSKVLVDIEWFTSSGHSALQQGDSGEALHCFKKAFKAAAEIEEIRVQRACAFNLGAAYVEAGKPQKGLDFLKKAQPGERGERVADLQFNLGVAHEALEDQAQAAGHYLQAARLYRSQGDGCSEGDTCMKLARCSLRAKDWTQAAQNFQRAGESYRVAGRLDSAAMALKEAGSHMLQSGSFTADDIITVFTECLELSVNIKDQNTLCKLYTDLGLSFSQLKLFPEAAECYEQALPLACSKPRRLAVVLQNLGAVHNTLSQYEQALDFHREAAALHGSLGSRRAQGRCFSNLAFALSQLENLEEAGENYLHSLQAFKDTEDFMGQWQACEGLGTIRMQLRDPEKAIVYYKQALSVLSKCKDSQSSAQEQLVNKLSEALQHRLSLNQRGPVSRRSNRNIRVHRQTLRITDRAELLQAHQVRKEHVKGEMVDNDSQGGEGSSSGADGEQKRQSEMMTPHSHPRGQHTDRELHEISEQPDEHDPSPTENCHQGETVKERTTEVNGEPAQPGMSNVTNHSRHEGAAPVLMKLRSRLCTVM